MLCWYNYKLYSNIKRYINYEKDYNKASKQDILMYI